MKKYLVPTLIFIFLLSCEQIKRDQKKPEPSDEPQYMFTVDSVKVYRFYDNGIQYIAIGKQGIALSQ